MMARYARPGCVDWIGLRPSRRMPIVAPVQAYLGLGGFDGDHAKTGKRAVTLLQAEHLPVIAALSGQEDIAPGLLRRNIVVSGLNLAGFRRARLRLGAAVVELTGPCPPCSRMEEALGQGGYTAMRGHGGYYAEVIEPGEVAIGAEVRPA